MRTSEGATPVEEYTVKGRTILVKRDDLYGAWPAPPLGKLRGARALLAKLYSEGVRVVGCWDTRISALGQGIAYCVREFRGMRAVVCYPAAAGTSTPEPLLVAGELGAEVVPVRAGRITISFSAARKEVEARGGILLPFGLDCEESVAAICGESRRVPGEFGTVIVSCGSGVTMAGLVRGLGHRSTKFVGVSSGRSVQQITRCLRKYISDAGCISRITIIPAGQEYSVESDAPCPFPSHPNYDRKAWDYLVNHIHQLDGPVLFWNVGAAGTGRPPGSTSREHAAISGSNGQDAAGKRSSRRRSGTGGNEGFHTTR